MASFEHKAICFNYIDIGEGFPFIFQHGLGGSVEQPKGIYPPPQGVRLLSFDFRGHGETPMGPQAELGFDTFADDLIAFMDYLQIEKAIVGGISMGAAVSLNVALRYPDRILGSVFSRPAWLDQPMDQSIREMFQEVVTLIEEYGPERGRSKLLLSERYKSLEKESPAVAQSYLGYFDYKHAAATTAKYLSMPSDSPNDDKSQWKKIKTPVLVLANGFDPVHPLSYGQTIAQIITQAEFREITAKSIDSKQHSLDVQNYLNEFIKKYFIIT